LRCAALTTRDWMTICWKRFGWESSERTRVVWLDAIWLTMYFQVRVKELPKSEVVSKVGGGLSPGGGEEQRALTLKTQLGYQQMLKM